jgi:hypothetical protein
MKKVLVGFQGYINEIKEPGQDHEVYTGPDATFLWVDAPDDVEVFWTLEYSPSKKCMVWCKRPQPFTNLNVARRVAYGEVNEQLGMLFDDIKEHGAVTRDGLWFQHVEYIKSVIPKPPVEDSPKHLEEMLREWASREPSIEMEPKLSSSELQCWVRYPGWSGYVKETGMPDAGTLDP